MIIRADHLFSYWIVAWFLLFYAIHRKGKIDEIPSPKLAFIIAIFENIVEIGSLFSVNQSIGQILKFCVTIFLFKILPLYLMWDIPIELMRDIFILVGVFIVYIIYLNVIGTSILEIYMETNKSLETNGNRTPFYRFLDWISEKLVDF